MMDNGLGNPLALADPSMVATYDPVTVPRPGTVPEKQDPWQIVFTDAGGNFIPYDPQAMADLVAYATQLAGSPARSDPIWDFSVGEGSPVPGGYQWSDYSIGPEAGAYVRGAPLHFGTGFAQHPDYEQLLPAEIAMFVQAFLKDQISLEDFGKRQDELIPLLVPGAQYDPLLGWYAPKDAAADIYGANKQNWLAMAARNDKYDQGWLRTLETTIPIAATTLVGGGIGGAIAGGFTGAAPTFTNTVVNGAVQGAAAGALQGFVSGGDIFQSALKGAASGGAGAGAVGVSGVDSRYAKAAINGATQAATRAAMSGASREEIFQAAAMGAASGLGSVEAMPTPEAAPGMLGAAYTPAPAEYQPLTGEQMLGLEPVNTMYTPAPVDYTAGPGMLPDAIGAASGEWPDAEAGAARPDPSLLDDAGKYLKYAKKVYDIYAAVFGSKGGAPEFEMPEREDGQTDADYASEVGNSLVEYLDLDADAMADAGLIPGSPEYLAYIMEQANAIIAQVFGEDPGAVLEGASVESLQAALKDLTDKEAQQLVRALYARGALEQMSSASKAVDPFSGKMQEFALRPGQQVNPAEAARQRGYAETFEGIATSSPDSAAEQLRELLGRGVDLYGMQGAQESRMRLAELTEQAKGSKKKKKGMLDDGYDKIFGE